jgi:hypothetical protein
MKTLRLACLLLFASTAAFAQDARRVRGTVYDSIARAPLAGAVVEIVMVDSGRVQGTTTGLPSFAAVTDSLGQFEVTGLPRGLYAVGFQHAVLGSLGIESPVTPLDLRVDSVATLDLGTPNGPEIRLKVCGTDKPDEGLLTGYLTNARGGAPLPNASVVVTWDEIEAVDKKLERVHRKSAGGSDETGRFSVCSLPIEAPLQLQISSGGFRDVGTEIELPQAGVLNRDFRLADTSTHGKGVIRVRVVDDSGTAMTTGRVMIVALGRRASIDSGIATIGDLPIGTWSVEVRSIGYEPASILADADSMPREAPIVKMTQLGTMLAPVSIVANATIADNKVLDEVQRRMKGAGGTMILPSDLSLKNAIYASDGLRFARGFRTFGSSVQGRPFFQGMGEKACVSRDFPKIGEKSMIVYLDGIRVPFGLQGINDMVRPEEILAIEAYPDVISAPGLWKTNDACAVVAFWTRR